MQYTPEEIRQYAAEEDVKFIRMAFCDVEGRQKNIAIMPGELDRAFRYGIAIDGSAIPGFGGEVHSDLLLYPDPSTLCVLPWRPEHGRVVRMFCAVTRPDGTEIEADARSLLKRAVADAEAAGLTFTFGTEMEFYLFCRDENGEPTKIPYDEAGYMDIAPADKGENIRREVCLTLEQMGIRPESSHHEEGPGQNEIDFRYSDPVTAADNAVTFRTVVDTAAARNGLWADFGPKPLADRPGNGLHINFSVTAADGRDVLPAAIAGIFGYDAVFEPQGGILSPVRELQGAPLHFVVCGESFPAHSGPGGGGGVPAGGASVSGCAVQSLSCLCTADSRRNGGHRPRGTASPGSGPEPVHGTGGGSQALRASAGNTGSGQGRSGRQ